MNWMESLEKQESEDYNAVLIIDSPFYLSSLNVVSNAIWCCVWPQMHFTSWRRRVTHIRLAVCWSEWMSLSKLHSKSKEAERDTERGSNSDSSSTPILLFQAYSYVNIETSTFSFWQSSTEHISSCCTLYWRCSYYRFYQRNLRYITLRWVVVNTVSKVCSTKFTKIQCVILIHYSHYQVSKCTLTITLINESHAKLFVFFLFFKKKRKTWYRWSFKFLYAYKVWIEKESMNNQSKLSADTVKW